ncbi:hypothetical protein LTR78_002177 [Recurvomyces mirabilis]|uniref:Uncharacterized protein n=1 Tax=Recurvomyces mirabilis TaxID=574656 RepID=A0AAE0WUI6_9PEZI|nr:hypothetical protein LTR78_002177 [Recurvomyces mirabilis]KAK5160634.1 hypothetical protein LTS14_001646 [Recurvomyces mirabilis]
MADLLRLPSGLRALAAHLEHDDRPSAIAGADCGVVSGNAPFRALEASQPSVADIVKQWTERQKREEQQRQQQPRDGSADWLEGHTGRKWKETRVLDGYSTLVCIDQGGGVGCEGGTTSPVQSRLYIPGVPSRMQFVNEFDWTSTDLGPVESWNVVLRTSLTYLMHNPNPRLMIWGPTQVLLYNEASLPILDGKHPQSFGQRASDPLADIWHEIGPKINTAMTGQPTLLTETMVLLQRNEHKEESYWDISFLPILGQDGHPLGLFCELLETTPKVRGERRHRSILHLNDCLAAAQTLDELWPALFTGLKYATDDVPSAMFYSATDAVEEQESNSYPVKCVLHDTIGLDGKNPHILQAFGLEEGQSANTDLIDPCLTTWRTKQRVMLSSQESSIPSAFADPELDSDGRKTMQRVIVAPVRSPVDDRIFGFFLMALNPYCPLDQEYILWTNLLTDMLTKTATLIVLPEEQRRAQRISDELTESLQRQLRLTTLEAEKDVAKFRRIAESAPTGMILLGGDGAPLHVNDKYLEMIGDTREHYMTLVDGAHPFLDHVHPDDLDACQNVFRRVFELKEPVTMEYRCSTPAKIFDQSSGQTTTGERWFLASAFPELDSNGVVVALFAWLMDISHQKLSNRLVAQRLEEALEQKRQTENFIDMTSHEMRNPLSAILQSADAVITMLQASGTPVMGEELVLKQDVAEEIIDAAQTIILCAQHQKRIVDDILTLSKLDASLLVLSPDKIQPPQLIKRVLKMYESELQRADIQAKLCIEPSYGQLRVDWIILDSSRLLQVIINLVTNAIKFTQYSEVRKLQISLGASLQRPSGEHHGVDFIPMRAGQSSQDSAGWGGDEALYLQMAVADTGSGLSADEMKLLFQRFSQASPKTYKQYGGSGLGLFISRELVELQGGQIGVSSAPGETTFTFFVKARRWMPGPSDQVTVLPSITSRLPSELDNSTASARSISPARPPNTYVLQRQPKWAETSRATALDPRAGNKAPHQNGQSTPAETSAANAKDQLHILIVEDNMVNQRVMSQQLRRAGCFVRLANHGGECLDILEGTTYCSGTQTLSLILLDLEMPTMDGLACIGHIRDWQANGKINEHVPVIAVTANARSEQIAEAISAGMDEVVTKPFTIPELMPQMHNLSARIGRQKPG